MQAHAIASFIAEAVKKGAKVIEPKQEAVDTWVKACIDNSREDSDYRKECTSGYYNNQGDEVKIALLSRIGRYGPGPVAYGMKLDEAKKGELAVFDVSY